MNIRPLCIIQARYNSTRLPGKMLIELGGETLIAIAWRAAYQIFREEHCVVALPMCDSTSALGDECRRLGANYVAAWRDERDVLGRFWHTAHTYRDDPTDVIVRVTPDDFPIDVTRERFSLAQLDHWHATVTDPHLREHIGLLIPQRIEINTREDYDAARERLTPGITQAMRWACNTIEAAILPNTGFAGDIFDNRRSRPCR